MALAITPSIQGRSPEIQLQAPLDQQLTRQSPGPHQIREYPSADDSPAEARAWGIRRAIVEQFGTPGQKELFEHPKALPWYPKLMPPINTWQIVFATAQLNGFRGMGGPQGQSTAGGSATTSSTGKVLKLLLFVQKITGDLPGVNAAQVAAANASSADQQRRLLLRLGLSRMREAEAMVEAVLSPQDLQEFKAATYAAKASKLFKVAYVAMSRQRVPDALVLSMCDAPDEHGNRGESAREGMADMFPSDARFSRANWDACTLEQRWNLVTEGYLNFFKIGAQEISDPIQGAQLVDSLGPSVELESLSGKEIVESVLGPEGAKEYDGKVEERSQLKNVAIAMLGTINAIRPILIVDVASPAEPGPP